ncbi:hypothetical protein SUGI_0436970 [Cryptomeria japonica]|uniref:UPF0496 protein 4 n=1 Tax=Cryptomeria japonica TaxID=3369 RepID=UPI002408DF2B|nr:UPF0496 protein 4 [Cryptomeria japonica]XP_057814945.2 UPF0496 protein 4 [Cryptomeria japonica]GLJ23152.1 hypothetical protein SUGI_0436970 [Cryptomeria japonica]
MSRPHDGHPFSSFFGNHFRMVIRKRLSSFNSKHSHALKVFETSLADRLKQLQLTKPKGFINLAWMQQATEVLCATHKDLRSFIADLQFPLTKWDKKWIDEYLDDSLKLLDICNLLNAETSKLEISKLSVQYVLHLLDFSGGVPPCDKVSRAKDTLQDLTGETKAEGKSGKLKTISKAESCTAILHGMNKSFHLGKKKCSSKGKLFMRAMYGVKVITLFVCSILTSALSGSADSLGELHIPERFLWSASFRSLQQEVNEDTKNGSTKAPVLKELEDLDAAVKSVHLVIQTSCIGILEGKGKAVQVPEELEEVVQIREGVKELRDSVEMLSNGLDSLKNQVNEFFQIVLNGRNELLESLRVSDDTDTFENGVGQD